MNKVTILGSGTSTGVPILGCKCSVCQSADTRNKRLRSSILIETSSHKNILIDTSPDLRTQLLSNKISQIDAAIITHDHADHTHGMDDLRPFTFNSKKNLMIYADEHAKKSLTSKFPYIFQREKVFSEKPILGGGIPMLDLVEIAPGLSSIEGEDFEFFELPHGHGNTLAFRHDKMAYAIDCREIPSQVVKNFHDAKLDLLIIDCLKLTPHQTHLHLDLTLEYIKEIRPKLAVLTHMGHELEYLELMRELMTRSVKNIQPALDNQHFLYSK
ncbi:MAG: MBL fold metallo-hydrolase [Bacteriovoracaceae bacterium]